jgi:hypothetical protein
MVGALELGGDNLVGKSSVSLGPSTLGRESDVVCIKRTHPLSNFKAWHNQLVLKLLLSTDDRREVAEPDSVSR